MPSSHSGSLFYFFSVISLKAFQRSSQLAEQHLQSFVSKASYFDIFGTHPFCTTALVGIYAVSASMWRTSTFLHTLMQTLVGAALGSVSALVAFSYEDKVLNSKWFVGKCGRSVPPWCTASLLIFGGLVLFKKEIKRKLGIGGLPKS